MEKLDLIDFDMRSNCDLNWAKGYAVCREKLNAKIKEIRGGKMKKNFIRFKECNSWEGETWNFYIPVEGNEKAIKRLAKILEKYPSYTLYPIPLSEKEVDILVKNNNEIGYMARHDKLEGKLDFSDFPNKSINGEEDPFYKGDIKEYLKGEK